MDSYNGQAGAKQYIEFINSENGLIEQRVLFDAIAARLNAADKIKILDAGCGTGWLTNKLSQISQTALGCDMSPGLIDYAKKIYPEGDFKIADLTKPLPYPQDFFSAVVVNMALHDIDDQKAALKNVFSILKPDGKLVLTVANPYYAYPVGVWKRGILGRLLLKKPKLLLRPYNFFAAKKNRKFLWGSSLTPNFYPLSEQINNVLSAGFALKYFEDLKTGQDSPKFNLQYQLFRFPYILLLEFVKN